MNKIFLDLEMNPVSRDHAGARAALPKEIIGIGAVMYDGNDKCIGRFCECIRPQYNVRVEPEIRKLTGITDEMLSGAETFDRVLTLFLDWCGFDFRLYCWSENDALQLENEAVHKQYPALNRLFKALIGREDVQPVKKVRSGMASESVSFGTSPGGVMAGISLAV